MSNVCPICGREEGCSQESSWTGYTRISCKVFDFTFFLGDELLERKDGDSVKERALDLITEHMIRQGTCGAKWWYFYYSANDKTKDTAQLNYINIAEKLPGYPLTVNEVVNRTLLNLAVRCPHYGDIVFNDYRLRRMYFEHDGDMGDGTGVIMMLADMGLLKKTGDSCYRITAAGWEKIEALQHTENEIRQGFIAMSFAEEMRPIREALKRAIKEAGYAAYISDEQEHNNQIVPEMFYEIGRSKFLVVDMTEPNYGAYYEAGYAQALGKQVIVCYNKTAYDSPDKKMRPHFDIAQKQAIVWETEEELVEKLKLRIEATVK